MEIEIPDDVKERWTAKAENLQDLSLPYPSATSLSLAGQNPSLELASALKLLGSNYPAEIPLDGGPAKCKALDASFYDEYVEETGHRPRGIASMEAVWLATDAALYYISPRVSQYQRWLWNEVRMTPRKQKRKFSQIQLATPESTLEIGLGTIASANLLTIYSWTQTERVAVQQTEPSRDAIHLRIEPGETVQCEGPGWDVSFNGAAWIVVTAKRVIWARVRQPELVLDTPFEKIHEAMEADGQIKLISSDPAYASRLKDPSNTIEQADTILGFPEDLEDEFKSAIKAGLRKFSPEWADHRASIERFAQRQGEPVTRWTDCPICGGSVDMRTAHSIHCGGQCGRYFTDPGFQPIVSDSDKSYGQLLGENPWIPLGIVDLPMQDRTRAWIIRPPIYSVGPLILADGQLEQDAVDLAYG